MKIVIQAEQKMNLVNNPELLNKYWKNHPPLMAIKRHIEELNEIYLKEVLC